MKITSNILILISLCFLSCSSGKKTEAQESSLSILTAVNESQLDTATFAGGCFWCVEASFDQIKGVVEAVSGYSGGQSKNPTYKQVASGRTNHAESVQVYYNPDIIDYETLLDIFFTAHDPTQLNRQGPDVGPQYRSAIFYHNSNQKKLAKNKIDDLENAGTYSGKIVTEIKPLEEFWLAEAYHQDYERKNPDTRYIRFVSRPKINKVKNRFGHLLKEDHQ